MNTDVSLNVKNAEKNSHFNKNSVLRNLRLQNISVSKLSKDCEECLKGKSKLSNETKSNEKNHTNR